MGNLMERLDNLRELIQEPSFLEGKGLSNEVNIRIFCYDPKEEMTVRHFTEKLKDDRNLNCRLLQYKYGVRRGSQPRLTPSQRRSC